GRRLRRDEPRGGAVGGSHARGGTARAATARRRVRRRRESGAGGRRRRPRDSRGRDRRPRRRVRLRQDHDCECRDADPSSACADPHELSGGMRQRVIIAMALALNPELIVMDEPTTALDVVVQREILQQVEALKRDFGFAVLFITHDLSLLLEFADRIAIMYAGEIVEVAPAERLGTNPQHPYTQGLLQSFPPITGPRVRLSGIPGAPPDLRDPPPGCRLNQRCPQCVPERRGLFLRQTTERPLLREVDPGHYVACHLVEEGIPLPLSLRSRY